MRGNVDNPGLATPDITPAQILAAVAAVCGLLVANGVIDNRTEKLITGIAAIVLPLAWVIADAIIRHGRSRALLLPPRELDGEAPARGTARYSRRSA
jgi:hypothetical protein